MRYSKSKYPIGATWRGTDKSGRIGTICFSSVHGNFEVWRWSVSQSDGSGNKFDWSTSYAACKRAMPFYGRLKRVKDIPEMVALKESNSKIKVM